MSLYVYDTQHLHFSVVSFVLVTVSQSISFRLKAKRVIDSYDGYELRDFIVDSRHHALFVLWLCCMLQRSNKLCVRSCKDSKLENELIARIR